MSDKDPVTPAPKPFTASDRLSALIDMTGDLDTAETLQKTLPTWLSDATPERIAALASAMRELQVCQRQVQPTLDALKPLYEFCRTELTDALTKQFTVAFDVEKDSVELPGFDCGCPDSTATDDVAKQKVIAKRSLLQAAMHNFTEDETAEDGFPPGGILRLASTPEGLPRLTPMAFAKVCRDLDVGKRYQTHFETTFKPPAVGLDIRRLKMNALKVDAHTALLKGDIGDSAFQMLQSLELNSGAGNAAGVKAILYEQLPVHMQGLELFGICIWGVVIFSKRSLKDHPVDGCVVYMPNEPTRPLYEYSTFALFEHYLTRKLKDRAYADFFASYIDESNKADFYTSVTQKKAMNLLAPPILATLFIFLYQSHVSKMQSDALILAVPTADVDADVRQKRLLGYVEAGLLIANLAGLFVPVLGQLMMGVAVGQLLGEVFEGIDDWLHDDKAEAMEHLLNIAENLATMVAFAAGAKAIGTVLKKTVKAHPEFFSQFEAITNAVNKLKFWKADTTLYQLLLVVDEGADAEGIYQVGGKRIVKIDDATYEVAFDATLNKWQVKHPTRTGAFSPYVEHNGEGGWRFAHEQPETWTSGVSALKRIDPRLAELDETRLEQIRKITDTPVTQLQHLAEENRGLPARFKDSVARFRIEQRLTDFIVDMEKGDTRRAEYVREQLHTLPSLAGWPADRYIEVLDDESKITAMYPPTTLVPDEELSVEVTEAQLANGELLDTVVAGLYQSEVDALLGKNVAKDTESGWLAKKIGAVVKVDRRSVFKHLYQRHDQSLVSDVQKVRGVFPELPAGLAQELIAASTSAERLRLRATGRIPMGLAQNIRKMLADIRLDRALAGFSLPEIAEADTRKLAIPLLSRLSGWSNDVRIELRESFATGTLAASVGNENAALKRVIISTVSGHEAFAGDGKSLGATSGTNSLYSAILRALPLEKRTAMGIAGIEGSDAWQLRDDLLAKGVEDRAIAERLFSGASLQEPAPSGECLQADEPVPDSTHPRALVRKVRKLYPLLTDAQARTLLDGLGSDHLTRAREVRNRQQALKKLRSALRTWRSDETEAMTPTEHLSERRQSRLQVSDIMENSWRRLFFTRNEKGISVPALSLDRMRVGKLPILPPEVTFDHVQYLSLKDMELDNDVAYFLKSFKNLESLELDANKLTLLPEILSQMPTLKHFSLANNDLQLTEQTLKKLNGLRTLETLNLSANRRLSATLDVGRLFDLRYLSLRDTRATEMPKNLARLPNLDRVDLRDNEIKELPDWLFGSTRRFSETLNLRHNPLSRTSQTQLEQFRERVGVGMGYLEDDIARLNEQQARELWLPHDWASMARTATWTAFKDDPASDGLFRLLAELGDTADAEYVREDMTRRVWSVLDAAQNNTLLREQVFELAANPINCTDSAALNFSHLEVAMEVDKAINPIGNVRSTATSLLKLGRGLFRLDELEKIAQSHIKKNPEADPLEVSLAYRTGLANTLNLPGQPTHMRYASLSGVKQADLDKAEDGIKSAELSAQLKKFLLRQPFWTDYLSREYPRQFASVNETYPQRLQALFEKAESLMTADYISQVSVIKDEKEAAENAVFERLTQDALKIADLGICVVSGT